MQIRKTNDETQKHLKVLIYGEPGSGKTSFIGTAPDPLILSAESGLLSLHDREIDFVTVDKFEDIANIYNELKLGNLKYKTVAIDSLTEVQQKCMEHILEVEGRDRPQIQDWGTLNTKMVRMIKAFRDLGLNVIITCLADTVEDQETMTYKTVPSVQGKLRTTLGAYFDEVFYIAAARKVDKATGEEQVIHKLLTHHTGKIEAKDRSGKLDMREDPSFSAIHMKIFGGFDK